MLELISSLALGIGTVILVKGIDVDNTTIIYTNSPKVIIKA